MLLVVDGDDGCGGGPHGARVSRGESRVGSSRLLSRRKGLRFALAVTLWLLSVAIVIIKARQSGAPTAAFD